MARLGGENAGLPFFAFLDGGGNVIVNSIRAVAGKPSRKHRLPGRTRGDLAMLRKAVPEMPKTESDGIEQWLLKHSH